MSSTPEDLNKWTVAQLKAELGRNDLETRGVKSDLISRLKNFRQLASKLELTSKKESDTEKEAEETTEVEEANAEAVESEETEQVANGVDAETKKDEEDEQDTSTTEQVEETEGKEEEVKDESIEEPMELDSSTVIVLEEEGDAFEDESADPEQLNASTVSTTSEKAAAEGTEEKSADSEEIPRRPELIQEARRTRRAYSFYLYPISTEDLDSDDLKPYLRKCVHVHYKCLSFGLRAEKLAGCLELQMKASEDVDEAEESLKNWKEGIRVVRLRPTDENICDIVADLMGFPGTAPVRHDLRTMVIQNLPENVKEDKLEELFQGCNVTLGRNAEGKLTGNAYLEFVNVAQVESAVAKCKDLELDGVKVKGSLISSAGSWPRDWADGSNQQKPLSLNALKKMVNQAVKLRVTIASSWQETHREADNKRHIEKVKDLESRLEKNSQIRRKRHLPDPDMWKRLRQDWMKKPSNSVDRNHQHLLLLEAKFLAEKLQKKLDRRSERKTEKSSASAGGDKKEGDGKKTEGEKGEADKAGKSTSETKKTDTDRSKTSGQARKRNQRDVQGRNLTVTVSNNMGSGAYKRQGGRQHDSGPYKRMRPDRSPMAAGGGGRYNQRGSMAVGNRGNRNISSLTATRSLTAGNYGSQNRGNFSRGGNYNNQGFTSGGGMNTGGSMGGDFSGNQMGVQSLANRGMTSGGGGGGGGQDTSNALNLLVGLSQMLSKQTGQNPLAAAGGLATGGSSGTGGSMGGYNQGGGSSEFRGSSGSYDNRSGYSGRSGYYEDRQGGVNQRMSDLDQRSYGASQQGMDGNYGNRYGGASSGRW